MIRQGQFLINWSHNFIVLRCPCRDWAMPRQSRSLTILCLSFFLNWCLCIYIFNNIWWEFAVPITYILVVGWNSLMSPMWKNIPEKTPKFNIFGNLYELPHLGFQRKLVICMNKLFYEYSIVFLFVFPVLLLFLTHFS